MRVIGPRHLLACQAIETDVASASGRGETLLFAVAARWTEEARASLVSLHDGLVLTGDARDGPSSCLRAVMARWAGTFHARFHHGCSRISRGADTEVAWVALALGLNKTCTAAVISGPARLAVRLCLAIILVVEVASGA